MRKEAVNTFNNGLNFDLNPLTTPNDVLTDCINGTFITFNGDELALQNDAGNIRINIPDESATEHNLLSTYNINDTVYNIEDDVKFYYKNISGVNSVLTNQNNWEPCQVKLSEGFYPLGIKEYGGVLYIVSGKKPDNMGVLYIPGSYQTNDIVYTILSTKYYFRSKVNNNTNPLPIESNDYWEYVGTEKDYINNYGSIEFGSYPSPETIGTTQFIGKELYKLISTEYDTSIESILYTPQIINNDIFKVGRKVKFEEYLNLNSSYISRYNHSSGSYTYVPKFYKIKLWHQLNNGFMDLTDYVWDDYIKYKTASINNNFWFNDPNFEFYCPTQYKGKLAISAEIEDLSEFKLDSSPELTYDQDTTNYEFVLFIKAVGKGDISVNTVQVTTYINNVFSNSDQIDVLTGNIATYLQIIPNIYQNEVITYTVTPIFTVGSFDYLNELPKEYVNKFIITGSRLISNSFDIIRLQLGTSICLTPQPLKRYVELILTDDSGNYIDLNLNVVPDPYVFIHLGHLDAGDILPKTLIRFYDIVNNKPVMRSASDPDVIQTEIPEAIKDLLESTTVVTSAPECGTLQITVNVNQDLRNYSEISVSQGSTLTCKSESTLSSIIYDVTANQNFTISINSPGYELVYKVDNITTNKTYNFGLIANCLFESYLVDEGRRVYGVWREDRPIINNVRFLQNWSIIFLTYATTEYKGTVDIPAGETVNYVKLNETMSDIVGNYDNISEIYKPYLCTIEGEQNLKIIFRRIYSVVVNDFYAQ